MGHSNSNDLHESNMMTKIKALLKSKSVYFAIAGAIGGAAGDIIAELVINQNQDASFWKLVLHVAIWAVVISICVGFALVIGQNKYMRRPLIDKKQVLLIVVIAATGGLLGGAAAQILFNLSWIVMGVISVVTVIVLMKSAATQVPQWQGYIAAGVLLFMCYIFLRGTAWALMGGAVGFACSYLVPNLKYQAGTLGGLLGGFLGGSVFILISTVISEVPGRILGVASIGFFIGLMIVIAERQFSEAWIDVIWAPNESTRISLGQKPVTLGASRENTIFLPQSLGFPAYVASILFESGNIIYEDASKKRTALKDGSKISIGKIEIKFYAI